MAADPSEYSIDTLAGALLKAALRITPVSDTPQLDASLLLAHALDRPRSFLHAHEDDPLTGSRADTFSNFVARRTAGEPVAYILGSQEFWSMELTVNTDVLIPRPETETLVEAALARIPADTTWQVADLGTGSGAIALAIASERPDCQLLATDASPAALTIARENARQLELANVTFTPSDWFDALDTQRFDMLVSNPPYVAAHDPHLQVPSMTFEPRTALIAADNGRGCLQKLCALAPEHLTISGHLLLEHGADQDAFVREMLTANGFMHIVTVADLAGLPRVTCGQMPGYA